LSSPSKPGLAERLVKWAGYFFVFWAAVSVFDALVVFFFLHISPLEWAGSAIIEILIAWVLLTNASRLRLRREGQPVPKGIQRVFVASAAFVIFIITFGAVGVIETVLAAQPISSPIETTMLSDLMIFDGVLIGFVAVLIGQDVRDRERETEAEKTSKIHLISLRNRRWGVVTLAFLTLASVAAFVSLPYADTHAQVAVLFAPIQFTVMGLGLLIGRLI